MDPGKRTPPRRPLPSVLGVKLSDDLRARIAAAAKADGVTDSAWLRLRALDALGVESAVDAASGPRQRIPDADLVVLSGLVRDVGGLYGPARAGQVETVLAGLDRIRAAVLPMVIGLNARSA